MLAGPSQAFAGDSSSKYDEASRAWSRSSFPSSAPPAPTASDERTCSSEPGGRGRFRRASSPTTQAGSCSEDAGCSRPRSHRARPSASPLWPPLCSWFGGLRPKIPFASPSSFSATRRPGRRCSLARSLARALLVSHLRFLSLVTKVVSLAVAEAAETVASVPKRLASVIKNRK